MTAPYAVGGPPGAPGGTPAPPPGGLARAIPEARYADPVTSSEEPAHATDPLASDAVRDPLAVVDAVLAARRRPMSERLELALSWNNVAAELRVGIAAATSTPTPAGD